MPKGEAYSPTKTLATLANRLAKKQPELGGVLYLGSLAARQRALRQVALGDAWGIGRQYAQKLTSAGIDSAADLAQVSEAWARKMLGAWWGHAWCASCRAIPARGYIRRPRSYAPKASRLTC